MSQRALVLLSDQDTLQVRFALLFALFYQSIGFIFLPKYVVLEICGVVGVTHFKRLPHRNLRSTIKIVKWVKTKKSPAV